MASFASSLLDELMGRDRDADPNNKRGGLSWDDPDVCKYYLCGFCPHDLFTNTRADLGSCDKIHEEELRNLYKKSSRFERLGYEEDFVRFLQSLIADVERRIRRGQSRLTLNIQSGGMPLTPQSARDDKIEMLTERINELVEQAEQLGCEGKVEEAQGVMKLCDQLKEERTQLENTKPLLMPAQKEMEVCHVCGAFQIKGDALSRMEDHLSGRQHRGYAQCRTYVEEHKAKVIKAAESERERIAKEQDDRDRELEQERERRRQRDKDRERGQERDRVRDRDRDDRRRRSRSRERHDRHRGSRDQRRSRSRERRRSKSRDRRRSKSRDHRSRSRDRRSSRDIRRSSSRGKRSRSRDRRERSGRSHRDRSSREKGSREKSHSNPNGMADDKEETSAGRESGQGDDATSH